MKKYILGIIFIIFIAMCSIAIGFNMGSVRISSDVAMEAAGNYFDVNFDKSLISETKQEIREVYEMRRYIEGVNDGAISVFIDKNTGDVIDIECFERHVMVDLKSSGTSRSKITELARSIIKDSSDDEFMEKSKQVFREDYAVIRYIQTPDDAEAIVYVDKKDGKVINSYTKDDKYINGR